MVRARNMLERFWSKVDTSGDCWLWLGGKSKSGYGQFANRDQTIRAHRLARELTHAEPVPEGMFVCHRCDNPACVNPGHLFLGTPLDNMRDKIAKGRLVASPGEKNGMWGVRKTHCRHGHPLTDDNVYWNRGQRHCAACRRERIAAWNAKASAERRARRGESTQIAS